MDVEKVIDKGLKEEGQRMDEIELECEADGDNKKVK